MLICYTYLKVAVLAFRSTLVSLFVTFRDAVEEIAVVVIGAILLKNILHFGLEKSHVHIYSCHLPKMFNRFSIDQKSCISIHLYIYTSVKTLSWLISNQIHNFPRNIWYKANIHLV